MLFTRFYGVDITLYTDAEAFDKAEEKVKINFSHQDALPGFHIKPKGILSQTGVQDQSPKVREWEGLPIFFKTASNDLPFDLFAAAFYLITRYEEYLPHKRDVHGRFMAQESLAFKEGFLHRPIVHLWMEKLFALLKKKYTALTIPKRSYSFLSTIDVDNAYAYKEKGLMRTLGAFGRSIIKGDKEDIAERSAVLMGKKEDPFNTFDKFIALHEKHNIQAIFFFLVADYGLNDKNVPITSRAFQRLIKHVNDYTEVGIHPSFSSNTEPKKLKVEIERLRNVTHREITKSRQHFLVLNFPTTYRRLLEAGITEDYTMGFPSEFGFRAGVTESFPFYDLEMENETPLIVHPFCAMEATLRYYKQVTPEKALPYFERIIKEVKSLKGTFCLLWHSDTLSGHKEWENWEGLYEKVLAIAKP